MITNFYIDAFNLYYGCLKNTGCTVKDRFKKGAIVRQLGGPRLYR